MTDSQLIRTKLSVTTPAELILDSFRLKVKLRNVINISNSLADDNQPPLLPNMRSKAYKDALLADIDSATRRMAACKDAAVLVLAQQGQYQSALDVP